MIKLVKPCDKYLKSYIEAYDEYDKYHITSYCFSDAKKMNIFEKFDNYHYERNLKPNRVGATFFWLIDDANDYFIGEITIRHKLNETLERYGGHIGYGIRYSEWNKGYGSLMLKLALHEAKKFGLNKVLITCDDDNVSSYKVMINNGFELFDKVENIIDGNLIITRRYYKVI